MQCCWLSKRWVSSVFAVFLFIFASDFLVHNILLADDYQATASLWRTQAEMEALGGWFVVFDLAIAVLLAVWFQKTRPAYIARFPADEVIECPIKSGGLAFGIKAGLLLGLVHAYSYIYLPMPGALAVKWFVAGLVQGAGCGFVLGLICRGSTAK